MPHYSGIAAINAMIGDLREADLRRILESDKMEKAYRFHPANIEEILKSCLGVIRIFGNAETNGDIIVTSMG